MQCAHKPVCDILEDGIRAALVPGRECAQLRLVTYVEVGSNMVREIFLVFTVYQQKYSLQVSDPVTYADFVNIPNIFTTYPYHGKMELAASVDGVIRQVREIPDIKKVLNMREDVLTCTTVYSFEEEELTVARHVERTRALSEELTAATWAPHRHIDWCLAESDKPDK